MTSNNIRECSIKYRNELVLFYSIVTFFILGFYSVTFKYNIYLFAGLVTLLSYLIVSRNIKPILLLLLMTFFELIPFQLLINGGASAFRIFKTIIVFAPMLVLDNFTTIGSLQYPRKIFTPIKWFMYTAAFILILDVFLFFSIGKTIGSFDKSGILIRPGSLMEDSNFYSYAIVSYIFFLKFSGQKVWKGFYLSLFLSLSFSAIGMLCILNVIIYLFKINTIKQYSKLWTTLRWLIISSTLFFHLIYMQVIIFKEEIITFINSLNVNELLKLKFFSMFLRFNVQGDTLKKLHEMNLQLTGAGAGVTRTLNDRNMNLHNTFYQMYVEMGAIFIFLIVCLLLYFIFRIKDLRFLLLFCIMTIFGNILEVYYYPLITFIFFLYVINNNLYAHQS